MWPNASGNMEQDCMIAKRFHMKDATTRVMISIMHMIMIAFTPLVLMVMMLVAIAIGRQFVRITAENFSSDKITSKTVKTIAITITILATMMIQAVMAGHLALSGNGTARTSTASNSTISRNVNTHAIPVGVPKLSAMQRVISITIFATQDAAVIQDANQIVMMRSMIALIPVQRTVTHCGAIASKILGILMIHAIQIALVMVHVNIIAEKILMMINGIVLKQYGPEK